MPPKYNLDNQISYSSYLLWLLLVNVSLPESPHLFSLLKIRTSQCPHFLEMHFPSILQHILHLPSHHGQQLYGAWPQCYNVEEFPGIRQNNDKASPCRRSSVVWLQERRCHPNFGRFQIVADADGKASLHNQASVEAENRIKVFLPILLFHKKIPAII